MGDFNQNTYNAMVVQSIDIDRILPNPNQPRSVFDEDSLKELAESIKENGVLQPITVRRLNMTEYELIAGERRWRASQLAGFKKIPAIIARVNDEQSSKLALIENIQREDLNCFEEAAAYKNLMDVFSIKQEELARAVGKSQPAVANKMRLLKLSEDAREIIIRNGLSERHARALLQIDDEELRDEILEKTVKENLTVAKLEELVAAGKAKKEKKPEKHQVFKHYVKDIRLFTNTVTQAAEIMRKSGVPVELTENKAEDYYEMIVRVPYQKSEKE